VQQGYVQHGALHHPTTTPHQGRVSGGLQGVLVVLLLSLRVLVVAIQAELPTQQTSGAGLAVESCGSSPTTTSGSDHRGAGAARPLPTSRSAPRTVIKVLPIIELC